VCTRKCLRLTELFGSLYAHSPKKDALFIDRFCLCSDTAALLVWSVPHQSHVPRYCPCRFLHRLEQGYQANSYHNALHAAAVVQVLDISVGSAGCYPVLLHPRLKLRRDEITRMEFYVWMIIVLPITHASMTGCDVGVGVVVVVTNQDSTSSRLLPGSSYSCCIRNLHALVHKQCHRVHITTAHEILQRRKWQWCKSTLPPNHSGSWARKE
jgi:hypothetical protein